MNWINTVKPSTNSHTKTSPENSRTKPTLALVEI
jgi:hypothetical protein